MIESVLVLIILAPGLLIFNENDNYHINLMGAAYITTLAYLCRRRKKTQKS